MSVKLSNELRYIKYEKCLSCGTEENLYTIIIENDYTGHKNSFVLCEECLKNLKIKDGRSTK